MAALVRVVKATFQKYPKTSNCIFYGSLYVTAEFSQQTFRKKYVPQKQGLEKEDYDWKALQRYGVLGTVVLPNIMNLWYKWLEPRFVGTSTKIVVQKVILDQAILTTALLSAFFVGMSIMEGQKDVTKELREKFIPTALTSCVFWVPAQAINFKFLPPQARVIYIGCCTFLWANVLCVIKRGGF